VISKKVDFSPKKMIPQRTGGVGLNSFRSAGVREGNAEATPLRNRRQGEKTISEKGSTPVGCPTQSSKTKRVRGAGERVKGWILGRVSDDERGWRREVDYPFKKTKR